MALKASYEDGSGDKTDLVVTGSMSGSAASTWMDLPDGVVITAIHAVTTAAAKWQIGSSDKSLIRDLVLSTHVVNPTASNAGIVLEEAIPGGGAAIRLLDTSGSTNVWTAWIKYVTPSLA